MSIEHLSHQPAESQDDQVQLADSIPVLVAMPSLLPTIASRQRKGKRTWSLSYFPPGATPIASTSDFKKHKHELDLGMIEVSDDGRPRADPSLSPIYDLPSGLAAVKAGTHEIDVQLDFLRGGVFTRPSGGLNLYVVPRWWQRKDQKPEHAMLQVVHLWNSPHLRVKVSPQARAGLLGDVVDQYKRKKDAKSAADRAAEVAMSATSSPLPTLPPGIHPLELYVAGSVPVFSRSQLLLTVKGHRILFLDTPGRSFTNKWIEWECRLLYPNYPMDSIHLCYKHWWSRADAAAQQVTPVEGVHYRLLMAHSDRNQSTSRLCAWRGANGSGNGHASVDLDLIESLVDVVAPGWVQTAVGGPPPPPSMSAGATDEATVEEIVLLVLAFFPVMTMAIFTRRELIQLWPIVVCLLLLPIFKMFQLI